MQEHEKVDLEEQRQVQIKRLKLSRRAHRGQMTKLSTTGQNLTGNLEAEDNMDLFAGIIESMETKLKVLDNLNSEIIDTCLEGEIEEEIIEADEYSETIKVKVRRLKSEMKKARQEEPQQRSHNCSTRRMINLPKLDLPKFNGDVLTWITFKEGFEAAVASDANLSDVQKFQYLRGTLQGEAARTITGLPLSNANYTEAFGLLEKRYGQPHRVIAAYMKTLWELPRPGDSVKEFKEFHDSIETCVRALRSLGKTEDTYGELLVPIVLEKLPGRVRTQISRDHGDNAWTLTDLQDALYREIEASEAGEQCEPVPSASAFHVSNQSRRYKGTPKTYTNHPKQEYKQEHKQEYKLTCAFCRGEHKAVECLRVSTAQERFDVVARDRLCLNCLKKGHPVKECKNQRSCFKCRRRHHTSLCGATFPWMKKERPDMEKSESDTHVSLTPTTPSSGPVLLKTANSNVTAQNGNSTGVSILFDEGAQRTFITKTIVDRLGLHCHNTEDINLSTFGANSTSSRRVDVADIVLETKTGPLDMKALVVAKISTPVRNHIKSTVISHPYLQKLDLAHHVEEDQFEIDLLIGADYYWSLVGNHIIRGNGPTAVSSRLGYLLSGPSGLETNLFNTMVYNILAAPDNDILADYWKLETIGIKDDPADSSHHVTPTFEDFQDKIVWKGGRYTASLPWKSDHPTLPTNFNTAVGRTRSLIKRMDQDTRAIYDGIIADQLKRGFIEVVEDDDNTKGHYIPHHAVHKESATTPIRIVYDCSCKVGDHPSLNDCLEVGPNLSKDLTQILLRFRTHNIGFISDIEKAFLNIEMHEADRPYTKFLWLEDAENPESKLVTFQFKSILFGSASSPCILNSVIRNHLEKSTSSTTTDMLQNIYVDNLVSGAKDDGSTMEYYHQSIKTLQEGGFNLRSWTSNSTTLKKMAELDGRLDADPLVKVLGMYWDTEEDDLCYTKHQSSEIETAHTKREVVRRTSELFDPLGFLAPVHIKAKMFIQQLWTRQLEWDEYLDQSLQEEWIHIQQDLEKVKQLNIKRPYFQNNNEDTTPHELHVFADASMQAYGAVVYLKKNTESSFVISKNRVRPLKDITLPRLELLAAFIVARLAQFVLSALHGLSIQRTVLWSDSQIVLHWIYSTRKLPMFVENRVKVIRQSNFDDIRYCPTTDNPADLLTRGVSTETLKKSELWMNGPQWLSTGDQPIWDALDDKVLACQTEETNTDSDTEPEAAISTEIPDIGAVIDITRFNCFEKLLRVTAYVLRFIKLVRKQTTHTATKDFITVTELDVARDLWIRSSQSTLREDMKSKKKQSVVRQLKLFIDDHGVIRCGGRLHNADIGYEARHPILIPREHPIARLLVTLAHSMVHHAGPGTTVTFIRNSYWIPRIRQVVKAVLRSCVTCRKVEGKPYRIPVTPPLPKCRLEEAPPFTVTGVDYTGTLLCKDSKTGKAYICLFTCAVTRALHLEVVTDMSTRSFLHAFRRFSARRSLPRHLISDNGTTFIAASTELQAICDDEHVKEYLTNRRVQWTFIPKRAPWFGGFYERLIGITKTTLKKNLGSRSVTLDELTTLITEAEAVINDRPLTYVYSTPEEPAPLTPSMLLQGRNICVLPHLDIDEEEIKDPNFGIHESAVQRTKHLDHHFSQLWSRWRQEYLSALREAHAHNSREGGTDNVVKLGDVVLVHEDNQKRLHWPLAVITKLNTGNDGLVRSAEIKTRWGLSNRPIAKLYPLEVNASSFTDAVDDNEQTSTPDNDEHIETQVNTRRPVRQAANRADRLIKQWVKQLV